MVYLGLGTNLGDKEQNLRMSIKKIEERIGNVVSLSAFYATAPWGFSSENSFLNAAVCVETTLLPLQVLEETQRIERELGRTEKSVNGLYADRLIDIDLLLYDDRVMDAEGLILPHPLMTERRFVMCGLFVLLSASNTTFRLMFAKTMKELFTSSFSPQ